MAEFDPFGDEDEDEDDITPEMFLPSSTPANFTAGQGLAPAQKTATATPARSAATSGNTTEALMKQAQELALKGSSVPTTLDGVMAGLSAKMGKASKSKAVAFLEGLVGGATAGYQGMKKKDDSKEMFDRVSKLAALQMKADSHRQSQASRDERTQIYRDSVYGRGSGGKPLTPAQKIRMQKDIEFIMSKNGWQTQLDADDEASPRNKMPPEKRRELEAKRDADRKKLEDMAQGGLPTQQVPGHTEPSTGPGMVNQGRPNMVPQVATPPARPTSKMELPPGVDRETATAQARAALEAAGKDQRKASEITARAKAWGLPGF